MGVSAPLSGCSPASLEAACAEEDRRWVRGLGWLVTGIPLEQDAGLGRIALAMGWAASAASHQRQLLRLLDSGLDLRRCYGAGYAGSWRGGVRRVTLLLGTTSVGGRR